MIVVIPNLVNDAEIAALRAIAAEGGFGSGKASTGKYLKGAKDNQEVIYSAAQTRVREIVQSAIGRNGQVSDTILPKYFTAPLMSLYREGMHYGRHLDLAMSQQNRLRSDMSMTLFLSELDSYAGGELEIDSDYGRQRIRLPAGHAVFYPTLFPHEVKPVTRGERLACVLWVQSAVREAERRRVLSDLAALSGQFERPRQNDAYDLLMRCHQNLLRMWAS